MASSSHAAVGVDIVVCSSRRDDADQLCAANAPGVHTGGVLEQTSVSSRLLNRKRRKPPVPTALVEEILRRIIAAVCEF